MFTVQLPVIYRQTYTSRHIQGFSKDLYIVTTTKDLNCETECKQRTANGYIQSLEKLEDNDLSQLPLLQPEKLTIPRPQHLA